MPLLFWLDVSVFAVCTVVAMSLALMVLGAGLKRATNLFFVSFTLMAAAWTTLALLVHLSMWSQKGRPDLLSELSIPAFALTNQPGQGSTFDVYLPMSPSRNGQTSLF